MCWLLFLIVFCSCSLSAQDVPPPPSPTGELDTLVARGQLSPELFLALGNAHVAAGRYGPAVLNYRRGLRLAPGNKDLLNNLRYVRAEANLTDADLPAAAVVRWWRRAGAFLGATTAFVIAVICWWLAVAGLAAWLLYRRGMDERRRFVLLPAAALCLALSLTFYFLGSSRNAWLEEDRAAVLVARVADLRVAPGADATLERTLTHGHDLRVLDERGGFVKVSLVDGSQGWLPGGAVLRVGF